LTPFVESGNTLKALDAAVKSRQWNRAIEMVEVVKDREKAQEYYGKIAEHYASVQDYEVIHSIIYSNLWRSLIELQCCFRGPSDFLLKPD